MNLHLIKKDPDQRFRDPKAYYERRREDMLRTNPALLGIILLTQRLDQEQMTAFYAMLEEIDLPVMIPQEAIERILGGADNLVREFHYLSKGELMALESHLMFLDGEKGYRDEVRLAVTKVLRVKRLYK